MPSKQFFSYITVGTSYIWRDDDDVHFVLDQQASLHFSVLAHWNSQDEHANHNTNDVVED